MRMKLTFSRTAHVFAGRFAAMLLAAALLETAACRPGSGTHASGNAHGLKTATLPAVHGEVLQVETGGERIYARHDAFAGMPAMTMEFALPAGTHMTPGEQFQARADVSKTPWALSEIVPVAVPRTTASIAPRVVRIGEALPDLPARDQNGSRFDFASLRGRPFAISFIYTRCRDAQMCPATSAKFVQVQHRLAGTHAALVEVSLDPSFDTPPVLRAYAARYGLDARMCHLLTASPAATLHFADTAGILQRRTPNALLHTERVVIVDGHGRVRAFLDDTAWTAAQVIDALRQAGTF